MVLVSGGPGSSNGSAGMVSKVSEVQNLVGAAHLFPKAATLINVSIFLKCK